MSVVVVGCVGLDGLGGGSCVGCGWVGRGIRVKWGEDQFECVNLGIVEFVD